jgi:hypothetical protein
MRVGPSLMQYGTIVLKDEAHTKRMAFLFDIVCQNFEANLDSILGLHEGVHMPYVKAKRMEPECIDRIFSLWKDFVDSLPKPRLSLQSPSKWSARSAEKEPEGATQAPRCLLWHMSAHKVVLLAQTGPKILDEDCLLLKDLIQFLLQPRTRSRPTAAAQAASSDPVSAMHSDGVAAGRQEHATPSMSSSVADPAESLFVGAPSAARGAHQSGSSFPDTVYLGQIDEKLGTFCAGKKEFRLFQNVFFEDQDGVLVLQSLLERKDVPNSEDGESIRPGAAAATSAAASTSGPSAAATGTGESGRDKVLFAAVDAAVNIFKRRLQKDHPSNPWSPMVHHSMDHFIMAYPGLVQFLCVNR